MSPSESPNSTDRVRIWDAPTRLFHWALVALVLAAWRTAETRNIAWHVLSGIGIAGLLVFRLWWGFFGGSTARFSQFVRGPRRVAAYAAGVMRRESEDHSGHNPMGGWSVVALLLCLVALIGFGFFAVDVDGMDSGPLSDLVSFDAGRAASHFHVLAFRGLEILVGLHVAAILFYALVKRQNLVAPMLTGRRRFAGIAMTPASPLMLAAGLFLALAAILLLLHLDGIF